MDTELKFYAPEALKKFPQLTDLLTQVVDFAYAQPHKPGEIALQV